MKIIVYIVLFILFSLKPVDEFVKLHNMFLLLPMRMDLNGSVSTQGETKGDQIHLLQILVKINHTKCFF